MTGIILEVLVPEAIQLQDVQAINRLSLELRAGAKPLTMEKVKALAKDSFTYVARDESKRIIGKVSLFVHPQDTVLVGRIEDEIVTKKYRDQHIGKQLMELAIQTARRHNLEYLYIRNPPKSDQARTLCVSVGFDETEDPNIWKLVL